jgi:hypothetical protein
MSGLLLLLLVQAPDPARLERDVVFLSSPELKGRDNGTPEGERAAAWVAERMGEAGLKPGIRGGWFHDFEVRGAKGRNVAGLIEGTRPEELVVVAAHHDARGVVGGTVQAGADDNASGVALILEVARLLAGSKPRRSILFVSFDAEEDGLLGSREFVKAGLHPGAEYAAAFVFDLVGGSSFDWEKGRVYALGSESSPELAAGVAGASVEGLRAVRLAVALIEPLPDFARSDYAAFRARGVPFAFFSTGTPWYYHTEHDVPARIDVPKLARVTELARQVVAATASAEPRPTFRKAGPGADDAREVRGMLEKLLESRGRIVLEEKHEAAARKLLEELEAAKETEPKTLQRAMILLLTVARAQGKP